MPQPNSTQAATGFTRRLLNLMWPDIPQGLDLPSWREHTLHAVYLVSLLAGGLACLVIFPSLIRMGDWWQIILDLLLICCALAMVLLRNRLAYHLRAVILLLAIYLAGCLFTWQSGPVSGGPFWIFCFAITAGIFFGGRLGLLALGLVAAYLTAVGLALHHQLFDWSSWRMVSDIRWLRISAGIMLLDALTLTAVVIITKGLDLGLRREREAIRELSLAHERFRAVLDSLDAQVYVSDFETHQILFANQRLRRSLGQDPVGKLCWQVLQNEATGPCPFCTNHLLLDEHGNPTGVHDREQFDPLTGRWYAIRERAVRWVDGRPVHLQLAFDITELKRAEQAIKNSEERFAKAFHANPTWMAISRLDDGCFLEVNDAFLKGIGYSRQEVLGRSSLELGIWARKEDRQRAVEIIKQQGALQKFETMLQTRQGSLVPMELWAEIIELEGAADYVLSVGLDLRERKQALQALEESERRFRQLFNSISDLLYTHDQEGNLLEMNPAVLACMGYEREEVLGRNIRDFLPDKHRDKFTKDYLTVVNRLGHAAGTMAIISKDGSKRYLEYRSTLVTRPGSTTVISGSARDVTQRIIAERNLQQVEKRLAISQKLEAVGLLTSGIAHDFNNLLQGISGQTQLLLGEGSLKESQRQRLIRVEESVQRAASLIKRLLTFSRKVETKRRPLDLNRELNQAIDILRHSLPRMVTIQTRLAPRLHPVLGDSGQLEQVILNLGANASDAMPDGGRLLFITRNIHLDSRACRRQGALRPGNYVLLLVADTGQGMDQKTLSRIFEPFFTTKQPDKGSGLGLSTVYGIVEGHQGHICCYSRPGRGSVFKIYFPALSQKVASLQEIARRRESAPRGDGETILLVEDEPVILASSCEALEVAGYQVICAATGEEALSLYLKQHADISLVVLDLSMPGMGGMKCLERLKRINPQQKILVASGYAGEQELELTRALGASGFLPKPYRFEDLFAKIRELLDG